MTKLQDLIAFLQDSEKEINRKKKQRKIVFRVIFSLLVVLVFAFILSETNRQKSLRLQEEISRTAKANSIATKAYTMLEHDPTLAFRLAVASYNIVPTPLNKQVIMASYANVPFYLKLEGHNSVLRSVKYSPDGKYIVTGSDDNNVILWSNDGKLLHTIKGHTARISGPGNDVINFSPDNKFIATSSTDSTARLWNLQGECLAVMKHNGAVNSVCFSPSPFGEGRGGVILTASSDKTARLWDLKGNEITIFKGHTKGLKSAQFLSDVQKIVTSSADSTLKIWNLAGKEIVTLKGLNGPIRDFLVNDAVKYIIACEHNGMAIKWSLDGKKMAEYKTPGEHLCKLTISMNGKYLLGMHFNEVIVWNEKGEIIKTIRGHTAHVWSAQFSPDGTKIATASDDATARLWDLEGNQLMALKGHTSQVFSAQFSPDGKQLVTASGDGTARIWTIEPTENPILKGHTGYVVHANFSPDGSKIVTAGWDYTARLWEKSGKILCKFSNHTGYGVSIVNFYKQNYFSVGSDGFFRIWNQHGTEYNKCESGGGYNYSISFNSDSSLLAIYASDAGTSQIINFDGKVLQKFATETQLQFLSEKNYIISISTDSSLYLFQQQQNTDSIHYSKFIQLKIPITSFTAAEFSQNGKWLITASEDSTLRVWNMSFLLGTLNPNQEITVFGKEKALQEMKVNAMLSSILFSPTEEKFVSVSNDNIIRLWNLQGQLLSEMKGHSDAITDVNFSADGKYVVSCSADKTVRLWSLDGSELMLYPGHSALVTKAKFSPDNKYILSCSNDHTARLMPVSVEMVLEKINKEKVRGEVWELGEKEKEVYGVR